MTTHLGLNPAEGLGVNQTIAHTDTRWLDWLGLMTLWSQAPTAQPYECTRCDVSGTAEAGRPRPCWSCGRSDALVVA